MVPAKPLFSILAALTVMPAFGDAAFSQASPTERPRLARAVDLDAAPVPESGAPDPLAPQQVDKPAPLAPGATETRDATPPSAEVDPVIVRVRQQMAASPPRKVQGDRDDYAAALAFYTAAAAPVFTVREGLSERGKKAVDEIGKADDWGLKSSAFDLVLQLEGVPGEPALADAEIKVALAVLKYARHARGGRIDPASASRKFDQKPVIFEPRSVLLGIASSEAADTYLRGLHPKHAQFERLRQALLAAKAKAAEGVAGGKSPAANVQQILANMERWRWMPPELGSFYVWDSIPDQMTSVVDDGKTVLSERIVVGKLSESTPIFSADMLFVIFHPSWGVPPGIKQNELLPMLRNTGGGGWFSTKPLASDVLRAQGLRATRGGSAVNPDSVDWASTDIRSFEFEQAPGPTNVLGAVKFRFPNKHDVYMHDTPERHLFGGAVRAFSHGCMRVQNPMHLAEVLLAHDKGWSIDRIKQQERGGGEIKLTTPIPVHVTYFTLWVDDSGTLVQRPDIYGLDGRVASLLEGREVQVASVSAPTTPRADAPIRVAQAVAKKRDLRKPVQQQTSFNPFGALFGN